jgi:hypothetical protein
VGALILVFMGVVDYLLLSQAVYGANTPIAIELAVGVLAVLVIIYVVRRLTNPAVALAFKEIPPE